MKYKLILLIIVVFTLFLSLYTPLNEQISGEVAYLSENELKSQGEPIFSLYSVDRLARVSCYIDMGTMASGKQTYKGAVAVSDREIKFGKEIYVEGIGLMKIEDRTALWVANKFPLMTIDIWMTESECKNFGLKYLRYKIL